MGYEEKTAVGMSLAVAFEVESGNNGLSRARGCYHKVAEMAVHISLHIQLLQYLLLIVFGTHEVESREIKQRRFPIGSQCLLQPFVANAGNEVLECRVAPICLKRIAHLVDNLWQLKLSGLEIPFLAILQGVKREIA